jgi:hypothetical protein
LSRTLASDGGIFEHRQAVVRGIAERRTPRAVEAEAIEHHFHRRIPLKPHRRGIGIFRAPDVRSYTVDCKTHLGDNRNGASRRRVAVYNGGSIIGELELSRSELKRRRQLPCAKERLHFGTSGLDRCVMRLHRDFGPVSLDPHRKSSGIVPAWSGFLVIDILSVPNAVMQRFYMGIIHDASRLA